MSIFRLTSPDCVFIHIPKTGGASIRIGIWGNDYGGAEFGQIPEEWAGLFKFTFVRHPLDRFMSAYRDFTQLRTGQPWDGSLEDFVRITMDESISWVDFRGKGVETFIRHHTAPMTRPEQCLHEADFIGRYESYAEDVRHLLRMLDKGAPADLPHHRKTESRPWQEDLEGELLERLVDFYAEDFNQLGYSCP